MEASGGEGDVHWRQSRAKVKVLPRVRNVSQMFHKCQKYLTNTVDYEATMLMMLVLTTVFVKIMICCSQIIIVHQLV